MNCEEEEEVVMMMEEEENQERARVLLALVSTILTRQDPSLFWRAKCASVWLETLLFFWSLLVVSG